MSKPIYGIHLLHIKETYLPHKGWIQGDVSFVIPSAYGITDEARIRGMEDMQRQFNQTRCTRLIWEAMERLYLETAKQRGAKHGVGYIYVTPQVERGKPVILMHPEDYLEYRRDEMY